MLWKNCSEQRRLPEACAAMNGCLEAVMHGRAKNVAGLGAGTMASTLLHNSSFQIVEKTLKE